MKPYLRLLFIIFLLLLIAEVGAQQPGGTRGIYFNGNQFIQVPYHASLNFTLDFTFEAWVKLSEIPTGSAIQTIISKRSTLPSGYQFGVTDGGKLLLVIFGLTTYTTAGDYITDVNRWYHVAVSFTNAINGVKFFVNGTLVEQFTGIGLVSVSLEPLRIGADNIGTGSNFFKGQIDGVHLSNVVRYTASFTPAPTPTADGNTMALYNFDEAFGQTIIDGGSIGNNGDLGTNNTTETSDAIRAIRTVNINDSGVGSLRQAITDANLNADVNFLDFSIPSPPSWTIHLTTTALPTVNTRIILEGTSQLGWSATSLIELNGAALNPPPDAVGLAIDPGGAGSEIYGMEIYGFSSGSMPAGIIANAANLKIGTQGKGNVISDNAVGIYVLSGATGSIISHNIIGLDKTGNIAQSNNTGIEVSFANNVQIVNNIVSANTQNIRIFMSNGSVIRGNLIGTDAAGTSASFSQTIGIVLGGGAVNIVVGGSAPGQGNIIGGHSSVGIQLLAGDNQIVRGNYIGTDISGTLNLGNTTGIEIKAGSINNVIGGTAAGQSNVIAYNGVGIDISNLGINSGNLISGNSIYCNTSGGIVLGGVNANMNKAAPVIVSASLTSVAGTAAPYDVIEIFRSNPPICGFAHQGSIYVATVIADLMGNWTYTGTFPPGSRITATARDASNNSSPFSLTWALSAPYTTIGNAVWNANGNWSLDGGITDCGCNPAGQNNIVVILRHRADVTAASDIGLNNIIELQNNGDLFLQVQPANQIAEIKTGGIITVTATLRFGYVPVSNSVVAVNNLDSSNPLVAVVFEGGNGTIPVRLGTEPIPQPYPSVIVSSGNKLMQFPVGVGSYVINGNLSVAGSNTSLTLDATTPGNTLTINGLISTVSGGATLNANDSEAKLIVNNTLRNSGGTVNGSLTGLEFSNVASATYEHQIDGGNIPTATWGMLSNCIVTGASFFMPGGWAGQQFGNLIWNCSNQNTYMAFNANFEVLNTFSVVRTRNLSFPMGLSVASLGNYTLKTNHFEMSVAPNDALFTPYGGSNPAEIGTLEITGNCTMVNGGTGVLSGVGTSRLLFSGYMNSSLNYGASFTLNGNARWVLEVNKSGGAAVYASGLLIFSPASGTPASFLRLTDGTFILNNLQTALFSNIEGSANLQMGSNSHLYLEQHNTLFSNTFNGAVNLNPTSTIYYRSANPQRIFVPSGGSYANLVLDGENHPTPVSKNIDGDIEAASLSIINNANFNFLPGSDVHVRITGDLTNPNGTSTITHNMAGYNHTLELQGAVNEVDNFIVLGSGNTSHVIYNRVGAQQVFASSDYVELTIDNGGAKMLLGNSEVEHKLNLLNGTLELGNFDLTYNGTPTNLTASSSGWVNTNGSGRFIQGTAGSNLLFPVGNNTNYQPVRLAAALAGSSARFGTPSPGLPTGSVGAWFINNFTTNTHVLIEDPQGGTPLWGVSEMALYNGSWNVQPTTYPFTNTYQALIPFSGTDQELAVTGFSPLSVSQPLGNRGMYFDGIDDHATSAPISLPNATMSAWIKPAAWGGGIVSTLGDYLSGINGYALELAPDGQVVFSFGEDGNRDQVFSGLGNIAPINQWTHVAGTYDGTTLRLFINGVLVNSATTSRTPGTRYVSIGSTFSWGWRFKGQIDEVRIFNTARTAAQILVDMGTITDNGAQAFWRFEEGTGSTASDSSPNSNTATLATVPANPLWALRVQNTNATGSESFWQVVADANSLAGRNYIDFSIPTSDPNYSAGVWTIQSHPNMPPNVTDGSIIDGYSAFGSAPATLITPATIAIQIREPAMGSTLQLTGTQPVTVRGLSIAQSVSNGLAALWLFGSGHFIQGNHIGVNAAGTAPFPASTSGCLVIQSSSNNTIGGMNPADRNVIGGAENHGIRIDGFIPSNNNQIIGNYIGVAADSITPLPNGGSGILINDASIGNQIGNASFAGRNIIANNASWGVEILGGSQNNSIRINRIYGNIAGGIFLQSGSNGNKAAPSITSLTPTVISGTCEPGDIVEVFMDSPQTGSTNQGRQFVGTAYVSGTTWILTGTFSGSTRYTAKATSLVGNTSPFSASLPTLFTSAQSGNWSTPATWVGGTVPHPGANIVIQSNHVINADATILIDTLTIAANGELNMLSFNVTVPTIFLGGTFNLGTSTHSLTNVFNHGGTGKLIANNGTTAALIGPLTGDFFTVASNTVIFDGSTTYNLPVRNYPTLQVSGTGNRILPPGAPITITGHISNNGVGINLSADVAIVLPNTGLIPHLIQGTSGTIKFNSNVSILGNTQVIGNFNCIFQSFLDVTAILENYGSLFTIGSDGHLQGVGTLINYGTVFYEGVSTPTIANLQLGIIPNNFIYTNGAADVAAANYDVLTIRGNRSAVAGFISANTIQLDNFTASTEWTLDDGSSVVVNGNLVLNNLYGATLNLGVGNATVLVHGNLLGAALTSGITSTPSLGKQQVLELKGAINQVGGYSATGDAIVRYSGANQQVFGSLSSYAILEIMGGGIKSLQASTAVNDQLRLFNGILQLGNYDLVLSNPIVANQLTGTFATSWVYTNGSGKFIRQGAGTSVVFPVGDATAVRLVTLANTAGNTEVSFSNTITPAITASNIAAGMWTINSPYTTTHLTFSNVGGTANATSSIHSSSSPWVLVPTLPIKPPYTTAAPVTFTTTPLKFTVYSSCLIPVITNVQDESAFLCSPTAGRITIHLLAASMTPSATYDVDWNGDNIWDRLNILPFNTNVLLVDNIPAGTSIINPRVRVANTACTSLPFPFIKLISGGKPIVASATITAPTSCVKPDGKLSLRITNGVINGFYHVDLNNDDINEFVNLPLQTDTTLVLTGIAEDTPLSAIKVTYALSNCASTVLLLNQTMPQVSRPAANLTVTGDTEADPDEILTISVSNIQADVSYRLMVDTTQIGPAKSGSVGSTLVFNTNPLQRNTTFRILAKHIHSGCEIELEQRISVQVYYEVSDSLILVALYNSANGRNWQPGWDLYKPVRTWHGVSVRKGRVTALNLKGKGLAGLINPVLQLARLRVLDVSENQLEFDAFEGVLPVLRGRGVSVAFAPQAPINEEQTITEFETKTITLQTTAKGRQNTYQWFKDNRLIAGATGAALTLRRLTVQDSGFYYCEVRHPDAPGLVILRRRIRLNVLQYMRSQTDSLILVELYRRLDGDNWTNRFDFPNPVATWYGIQTANGRVTRINLSNNNLKGEIPDIFIEMRGAGILDSLEYLNFSHNKISGRIPKSLSSHPKLTYLDLSYNLLEGEIPTHIGEFGELRTLWLSGNRFTRLPHEIGNLSKLVNLLLDNNQIEEIPEQIGQLRNLQVLRIGGNRLRTVPQSIVGTFGSLRVLNLADNSIESLPPAFNNLPDGIEQLLLHNNRLPDVPLSIADRPRLQLLTIYGNLMDFGTIEPLMIRFRNRRSTAQVIYAPQALIGTAAELTVEHGQPFTLTIQTGGTNNRYRWLKDDAVVRSNSSTPEYTVSRSQADDTGRYWVEVTNSHAPDLTLTSFVTQVRVICSAAVAFAIRAQGNTEICGNEAFNTVLQVMGMEDAVEFRWMRNGSILSGVQGRNFTPSTAGRYRAMVRTQGVNCFHVSSNEIEIRQINNVNVVLTVAQGGRLFAQATGNFVPQRYEWFRNGQFVAATTANEFVAEQPGSYTVSLITTSGCRFNSAAVSLDNGTIVGIEDWPAVIPLQLFPNPAGDRLTLKGNLLKVESCRMINLLGQTVPVLIERQQPNEWLFNISGMTSGIYLLCCQTNQGEIWMKWIKE
ncbi:MAG: LamG-like jellyroll fold domain-containing protein [Cytophagales bacterium]|nr:T9SS type A sorting domain-containing protein [Bernardetiaceae bacterium]MDW8204046.1 LamG-like jellyroll fold domain-containing protein [Cytophagales bacterium]